MDGAVELARWLDEVRMQDMIEKAVTEFSDRVSRTLLWDAERKLDAAERMSEGNKVALVRSRLETARANLGAAGEKMAELGKLIRHYEDVAGAIEGHLGVPEDGLDEAYADRAREMILFMKIKLFELDRSYKNVRARFDFYEDVHLKGIPAIEPSRTAVNFVGVVAVDSAKRLFSEFIPMAAAALSDVVAGNGVFGAGRGHSKIIRSIVTSINDAASELSEVRDVLSAWRRDAPLELAGELDALCDFIDLKARTALATVRKISDVSRTILSPNGHRPSADDIGIFNVSGVRGAINFIRELNRAEALERKVEIEIFDGLPEEVIVPPDLRYDLILILNAALDNAIKYGGSKARIGVSLDSDVLEIEISDDGKGLSEEEVERIIENPGLRLKPDAAPGFGADISIMTHGICDLRGWSCSHGPGKGLRGLHVAFAISVSSWGEPDLPEGPFWGGSSRPDGQVPAHGALNLVPLGGPSMAGPTNLIGAAPFLPPFVRVV